MEAKPVEKTKIEPVSEVSPSLRHIHTTGSKSSEQTKGEKIELWDPPLSLTHLTLTQ